MDITTVSYGSRSIPFGVPNDKVEQIDVRKLKQVCVDCQSTILVVDYPEHTKSCLGILAKTRFLADSRPVTKIPSIEELVPTFPHNHC